MKSSDRNEIRKIFEEVYAADVRSGNLQGYGDMYAENALWMPPNALDRRGINDITEGFAKQIEHQDIDPTFIAEEIEILGDFGYVVGLSHAILSPKDGSASRQAKYRALWLMKKEKGLWKIDRQIWNTKPE